MAYTMIHANKCDLAINALKQEDIYYCHNCSTPTTTGFAIAIVTMEIVTLRVLTYDTYVRYKVDANYNQQV